MSKSNYTMTSFFGVAAPIAGRMISNLDLVEQWLRIVSLCIGLGVGLISLLIGAIQLYRIIRDKVARRKNAIAPGPVALLAIAGILIFGSGCTFAQRATSRTKGALAGVEAKVAEESRALTTAGVDTLSIAPTNEFTSLALELAKKDQLLEGMPKERIDVAGVLAGNEAALKALEVRYRIQGQLIQEKAAVEAKLRETEARLVEMGKKYEAERNMGIVARVRRAITWTIVLGGIGAACFFCPVLLPILGRLLAWIVSLFPKLAGAVGVVSTKAFDAVVKGVEAGKAKAAKAGAAADASHLEQELSKAMDAAHKQLVRARKPIISQTA